MSLETETLLKNRNSNPEQLSVNSEIIEFSIRRLFRVFSALLILCFLGYLFTSSVFLAENRRIRPLLFSKSSSATAATKLGDSDQIKESQETVITNFTTNKYNTSTTIVNSIDKITHGQACIIPKLDPFHSSIKKALYETVGKVNCGKKFPLMFDTDWKSNLIQVREPKSLKWDKCCYRVITRTKTNYYPDDTEKAGTVCHNITGNITKIPQGHEFIGIYCTPVIDKGKPKKGNRQKMVDAFAFTHLKPALEKRIAKMNKNNSKSKKQVNLVVLGLDAVSHMNLKRIMPKVQKYLKNDLNAVSMNGYTKIGDNTFPNIVAALTSWNKKEIQARCEKGGIFDDCPFLWKKFSQEGYRTSYGEDFPGIGIFNYARKGFKTVPTDYYLRPIVRAMGNLIGHNLRGNAHVCYGPRMTIDVILNYMKKLASTMGHDKRYFQFLWTTALTHDYVSQGKVGESSVLSTLKWFKEQGHFNDTIFIFMSDHGIRWGPVREVKQGKIEENMPFLYFVFPEWFKRKYKSAVTNIKANENRLTSPYDTFETLKDILYLDTISEKKLKTRQNKLNALKKARIPRGISLFLPIPKFRTCKMAGIAEHYCVCHTSESVSTKNTEVRQAANYALYILNSYVAKYSKCAYLALDSVLRAQINLPQKKSIIKGEKIFEFAFTTDPGKGLFEATVVKNSKGNWEMSGTISRTNLYGNQSRCISDKEMKKFCYCIQS